jgi:hypothetical protein
MGEQAGSGYMIYTETPGKAWLIRDLPVAKEVNLMGIKSKEDFCPQGRTMRGGWKGRKGACVVKCRGQGVDQMR